MELVKPDRQSSFPWIWNEMSNAHACSHIHLFKEYTSFTSKVTVFLPGLPRTVPVLGVGTVELPVKMPSPDSSLLLDRVVCLKDVLYIEQLPLNVVARTGGITGISLIGGNTFLYDRQQNSIAYCRKSSADQFVVELGDIIDETAINIPNCISALSVSTGIIIWGLTERARWQFFVSQKRESPTTVYTQNSPEGVNTGHTSDNRESENAERSDETEDGPSYSVAEQLWLRLNFGSEHLFLRTYGFNPDDPGHRKEGSLVVRAKILKHLRWHKMVEKRCWSRGTLPDYPHHDYKFSEDELACINLH
ncbi:hypothetical protein F4825DRAFT_318213 [Nemania diffusa]|nr:hypothetical protein F4825DRAFT_318213 [Nemania diffusa]